MAIIISIGAKISEYTVEPIGRQLGYLLNYKSNVENLRTQIQHLKDERDKLQHSIDEAKKNSEEEIEADVANWLSRIDRMISQHSEKFLTNEGRANVNCLSGKLPDLGSRHRMSRKAKKMAMEAAIEIGAAGEFHKGVGSAVSAYGGPSSSQSAGEQSLSTSSKKGGLKCQSSVLDNDIGSIGPPVSGSLSIPKTGLGSVAAQTPSSSIQKLNSSGELKNDYEEASTENEESTMSSTSFSSVPTKSSGMDSKMLQQLDKLVLPKDELSEPNLLTSMDKSLTNMSPSVPHGQGLEAVDSSNYLGDEQDKKKLDASLDKKVPDARDTTSLEQDTVEESGRLKIVASCDKATDVVNDVDSAVPKKNTSMNIETTVYSNGAVSHSSADGTQKVDTFSAERKSHNTEAVILEKPPLAFLECKPSTSAVNNKPDPETSDGSVSAEKNSNFVNADASSPSMAILRPEVATQAPLTSDVASPPMVSNVALSIFNFGDKVASTKDSDAASPTCSFGSKPTDEVPETFTTFASSPAVVTESAATECGSFPEQKPETSSSLSIPKTGLGSVVAPKPSSSIQKLNSSGELKNDYEEATENEESTMPSTSFSSVLTKSSEMDSKILQQLDKLILPKDKLSEPNLPTSTDKSPTNMSPSMLHGQALKSLEAVDSSKFLGDVQDKLDASLDKKIPDARDTTSFEQDTVEESGRLKIVTSCDEATDVVNDVDSAVPKKNISMNSDSTVSDAPIFVASPPQKKWAFRMSVPEDFLELDDDDDDVCSNGAASHSSTDGTQKVDTFSAERKSHNTEAVILAKPPLAFLECKHSTSAVNKKSDPETYDGSVSAEVNSNIVNADASSPSMAVLCTEVATRAPLTSDVASPPMVSNVALPIFSFGDKVASTKDSDAASNTSSFGSKHADEVPEISITFASSPAVVTESAATESGSFPDPKPETSSRSVYMVEFSMGSGGGVDKFNRKFYRVNRKCNRGFYKVKGKQRRLSVGTGNASSTSIPIQFGSTTSSPSSGFAGNSISTGSSIFGSTTPAQVFGSGTTGLGSAASPSDTNPISSSSGTPTVLLGTSWQPAKYSIFGSTFSSASPSPGFSFGPSTASGATTINSPMVLGASTGSATTTNSAPMVFGASTSSAAATNSAPAFFGSSNDNNDQMNMEDSVAEDTVSSVPSVPVFGQQSVLPSPSPSPFQFGSAGPSASTPFQFGSQLNVPAHQNSSPFPVSGSMGLLPEGSNFSFGCGGGGGGGDKSNRKFYKVKGKPLKK